MVLWNNKAKFSITTSFPVFAVTENMINEVPDMGLDASKFFFRNHPIFTHPFIFYMKWQN